VIQHVEHVLEKGRDVKRILFVVVAFIGASLPLAGAQAADNNVTPGVIPPSAMPDGRSYDGWSAAWWQWAFGLKVHDKNSVIVDPAFVQNGPVDCSYGQTGHVWFLAGTFNLPHANRSCAVPSGTMLFPVIANFECDNVAPVPTSFTAEQLKSICDSEMDSVSSMAVTVDGVPVSGLSVSPPEPYRGPYRTQAGPFSYTLPADNIYAEVGQVIPPGIYPNPQPPGAFATGVYLMLAPLSVGRHTLHWTAEIAGSPNQDITYAITVMAKR
jgi:hypothetical protein